MAKLKYDCLKCVGYCCAIYERVHVGPADIRRLARYFSITPEAAQRRFTKKDSDPGARVLRRSPDPIFGSSCMFQDPVKRVCTIYDARPKTCRDWPTHGDTSRCVYYEVLQFERRQQDDDGYIPIVEIRVMTPPGEE